VENFYTPGSVPSPFWLYVSCMSHGSCGGTTPGNLTGHPDFMLDETATNEIAFPLTLKQAGASGGLYYDTMYAYTTGGNNPWTTQYYFGGNGDGNLMYPGKVGLYGLTVDTAVASVRMKMLRAGSYLVDYATLTGTPIPASLVSSVTGWSKNAADYQAFKTQMGGVVLGKAPGASRSARHSVGLQKQKSPAHL
jgi:hypothetical protein